MHRKNRKAEMARCPYSGKSFLKKGYGKDSDYNGRYAEIQGLQERILKNYICN